jgi:hypothetical protein
MSMSRQGKDGAYQVLGHRVNDAMKRTVAVYLTQSDASDVAKMSKGATYSDPLIIEVDDRGWSYLFAMVPA